MKNLPHGVKCHLSHRLLSYSETKDGIQLEFQNGRTALCNLLIAADGIKSIVRAKLMAKLYPEIDSKINAPIFSGTLAYRGLFPVDELAKRWPGHRALKKRMMVSEYIRGSTKTYMMLVLWEKQGEQCAIPLPDVGLILVS